MAPRRQTKAASVMATSGMAAAAPSGRSAPISPLE
eukprot:CAMPEP_0195077324 /NCGR_PEP_ID=MMETSP0448-20130528/19787_1 /TAXON_ID=66468 /ORGANISM="Heterocapsa triquestra, Strain CCMP 448" /LENGTH=34 /DNA_ID= /DNA_START= /DNA_END= /DNA_ORIENTATION=